MRTTFFTCCDKKYEHFIPIFVHSILYYNDDADIEIGVENKDELDKNVTDCISLIREWYKDANIVIRDAYFGLHKVDKLWRACPNVVRFIETPTIKNEYVYICDIDIITLDKNITATHVMDMEKTGLNYSNIVRPYTDENLRRLTGLHFSKWDSYYPIPDFSDLVRQSMLNNDEVFLYNLVKKQNVISEETQFRPVHGIHISANRENPSAWGLRKRKNQWNDYRNSDEFKMIETLLDEKIHNYIIKIDDFYKFTEERFTEIYEKNAWKGSESKSGPGSSVAKNLQLLKNLEGFCKEHHIKKIVDCGCGDFNWMKKFDFSLIDEYVGCDIVKDLITSNTELYANKVIKFKQANVIEDEIENGDLIICKDVLFHLSFEDVLCAIENFKKSKSMYLASTTFVGQGNVNAVTGSWRPINLQISPFELGDPIYLWENIENRNDTWKNKSIGIWKIN